MPIRSCPLSAGKESELLAALLPVGTVDLTIAPAATNATAYILGYEGKMSFGPGQIPQGKGKVTLTGMDKIQAALAAAPPEVGGQANMGLGIAGALAKTGADGELVWEIESGANGAVLVNGKNLSAMFGGAQ